MKAAKLLLPYCRAELPGWGHFLDWAGVLDAENDTEWQKEGRALVRGKGHGYLMELDIGNWSQRLTYFLGRYYELGVLLTLDAILRPGDTFVDVGANMGMISLHARKCVGPMGRVECFEPLPECAQAIENLVKLNGITNARIHQCALANYSGKDSIQLTSSHTGTATLGAVDPADVLRTVSIDVEVGDDQIDHDVNFVKIDVEGSEFKVLSGLESTLRRCQPFIITELIESQLNSCGTSVAEISGFLSDLGYTPLGIDVKRKGLRHELALRRQVEGLSDALWVTKVQDVEQWVI